MWEGVLDEVEHLAVRPQVPHGEKLAGSFLGLALGLLLKVVFLSHRLHLLVKEENQTFFTGTSEKVTSGELSYRPSGGGGEKK